MSINRAVSFSVLSAAFTIPLILACSDAGTTNPEETTGGTAGVTATGGTSGAGGSSGTATTGGAPSGGTTASGGAGAGATGGASAGGAPSGGASTAGGSAGTPGTGGMMTGGSAGATSGGTAGTGLAGAGAGGASGGSGGDGVAGSFIGGGSGGGPAREPLDCGAMGTAVEDHGPTTNRLNYVIVGDGYSESELAEGGTLDDHIEAAMTKRFSEPVGQPYKRYRNFINICVLRIPSSPICGSSEFGCCGNDSSRLANCNTQAVNAALDEHLPESFEIDFRSVMLNGNSWWNSGGTMMMWSGGNADAGGAALHEGGHGFHSLSDEYGNCEQGRVSREASYGVNVSLMNNSSGDKWDGWLDYNQNPGTGEQGFFACDGGQTWRPSSNSMMNSLFGNDPDTSYNPVSREKIIMDVWRAVQTPWDATTPEAGPVTNPTSLTVHVIDPEVISVDWTVDGNVVAMDGGPSYNIGAAALAPGQHTVTARAYDNAGEDLVRQVPGTTFNRQYWGSGDMGHSDKTVSWTVTIQ